MCMGMKLGNMHAAIGMTSRHQGIDKYNICKLEGDNICRQARKQLEQLNACNMEERRVGPRDGGGRGSDHGGVWQ